MEPIYTLVVAVALSLWGLLSLFFLLVTCVLHVGSKTATTTSSLPEFSEKSKMDHFFRHFVLNRQLLNKH